MANLKEVRTRIASVSSTQQITSAMKMVSAAKFRRAQNAIIGMRPYVAELQAIVSSINTADGILTPYHEQRPPRRVCIVVLTSNKGLCGAFNSNVLKLANQRLNHWLSAEEQPSVELISIGKKASEHFAKQKGFVHNIQDALLDAPSFDAAATLADRLMADYAAHELDHVEVVYNRFKNSLTQELECEVLLPVRPLEVEPSAGQVLNDYIFEPSKAAILRDMIPLTLRSSFYRMLLDSLAAEHGARMTAMQKATDNATELLKELRLSYNKARQAAITNEIIEIVSGSEALKG